jgi:hypothetical protein
MMAAAIRVQANTVTEPVRDTLATVMMAAVPATASLPLASHI